MKTYTHFYVTLLAAILLPGLGGLYGSDRGVHCVDLFGTEERSDLIEDLEDVLLEECFMDMVIAHGEVKDVAQDYGWYNVVSHILDISGKQMVGEITPTIAAEVLPYAFIAEQANKRTVAESEIDGYRVLPKEELPEALQCWLSDDGSGRLEDVMDWSSTGMRARVYQNLKTGDIVLAFVGTESSPMAGSLRASDWWRMIYNLMSSPWQAAGGIPQIYTQAVEWTGILKKHFYANRIIVTGLSLGGGLAQFAGLLHEVPVYAFNSVGLGCGTKHVLREHYETQEHLDSAALSLVTHVYVEGESLSDGWILTNLVKRDHLGRVYNVPCHSNHLYGLQRHRGVAAIKSLENVSTAFILAN